MSDSVASANNPDAVPVSTTPPPAVAFATCAFSGVTDDPSNFALFPGYGLVHVDEVDQFKLQYFKCANRNTWHPNSDRHRTVEGTLICGDEATDNYFFDDHEERWFSADAHTAVTVRNSDNEDITVSSSTRRTAFRVCSYTGQYHSRYNGGTVGNGYGWVSEYALDSGNFATCEECGEWFHIDDLDDDGHCPGCRGERSEPAPDPYQIQDYNSRAYPGPLRKPNEKSSVRLYGVENEVEVKSSSFDRAACARNVIDALGSDFAILKSDGSLSHGFEIVTAPASLAIHGERWRQLCAKEGSSDARRGLRSAKTTTCGLHIHVSRCDLLSNLHLGRVLVFMNEPKHKKFIEAIARRAETDWCRMYKKKLSDGRKKEGDGVKYVAVNLNHSKTIEFRIFKGTLTYRHFMSSLEFVDALLDFTKPAAVGFAELTPRHFAEFVKQNRKRWAHLTNELVLLGYLPQSARFGGKGKGISVEPTRTDLEDITTAAITVPEPPSAAITVPEPPSAPRVTLLSYYLQQLDADPQFNPFSTRAEVNDEAPTTEELAFMSPVTEGRLQLGDWLNGYPGAAHSTGEWAAGLVGYPIRDAFGSAEAGTVVMRFDPAKVLVVVRSL